MLDSYFYLFPFTFAFYPLFTYNRTMDFENKNFFWGILLGAAVAAIAGAVALTRSFRSSPLAGGAATAPPRKGAGRRTAAKRAPAKR